MVEVKFLMYRVELKVLTAQTEAKAVRTFLVYRVELKVFIDRLHDCWHTHVPNVPCELKVACKSVKLF